MDEVPADDAPADDLAVQLLAQLGGAPSGQASGVGSSARWRARRRAEEPRFSGPGPDERDPVMASSALDDFVASRDWQRRIDVTAAMARWPQIAGAEVAAHVQAESFDDGVLTLRADSTAWATQLRLLLPTVRSRIDTVVGAGVVSQIVVKGPTPPRTRGGWRVAGRGPRDTYG